LIRKITKPRCLQRVLRYNFPAWFTMTETGTKEYIWKLKVERKIKSFIIYGNSIEYKISFANFFINHSNIKLSSNCLLLCRFLPQLVTSAFSL
jgi:hypothetical protein